MNRERIALLGTGLFAEELTDLVSAIVGIELVTYVENLDRARVGKSSNGVPIVWVDDILQLGDIGAVSAITTTERERYVAQVAAMGIRFTRLVHPSAVVAPSAALGLGVVIQANVVIGAQTVLGDHVIVNRGALIGHHSRLGEFATVQAGANISGATDIGARAYVWPSATVLDHLRVGEGALIGAGAVVTRDVEPHVQVVGVPARVVKRGVTGRAS